ALCELRGISHEFVQPNGKPLRVLDDINLAILPEEIVALLGPSGCGKSTILRILAGLIAPTRGDVRYHNEKLHGLNPGIAIVFQSFALFPWMTVTQNVRMALKAAGKSVDPGVSGPNGEGNLSQQIVRRAAHAIRLVGLSGFEDAYPRELSGGMKQRVGMAR